MTRKRARTALCRPIVMSCLCSSNPNSNRHPPTLLEDMANGELLLAGDMPARGRRRGLGAGTDEENCGLSRAEEVMRGYD